MTAPLCLLRSPSFSHSGSLQCGNVTTEDVLALQSVAAGLPSCALKNIKARELLADSEALTNITKQMEKRQLKAMLQGVSKKEAAENEE